MVNFIHRGLTGIGIMVVAIALIDQGLRGFVGVALLMVAAFMVSGVVMWLASLIESIYRKFRG